MHTTTQHMKNLNLYNYDYLKLLKSIFSLMAGCCCCLSMLLAVWVLIVLLDTWLARMALSSFCFKDGEACITLRNAAGYFGPICVTCCKMKSWICLCCCVTEREVEGSMRSEMWRGRRRPIICVSGKGTMKLMQPDIMYFIEHNAVFSPH